MDDMNDDWADDDTMSAEETLRRFAALNPEPTEGPRTFGYHVVQSGNVVHHNSTITSGVRISR